MAFTLEDSWVWDLWVADDGESYHLYYLHAPRSLGDPDLRHRNARIGHATSPDLTNWKDCGTVIWPGAEGDIDQSATWTGSVVRDPDGLWRMFYTGSVFLSPDSNANIETVGMATSPDLFNWTKRDGFKLSADARFYETLGTSSWPEEAWRDPWVYPDPNGQGWHMLITARANSGDDANRGVVGHATSLDLDSWQIEPPLSAPGQGFGHLEVLQTTQVDGHDLLLFSCESGRLTGPHSGKTGGSWIVPNAAPSKPFDIGAAQLLVTEKLYACRIAHDRTGQAVLLGFESDESFKGQISDPHPLVWDEARGTVVLKDGSK